MICNGRSQVLLARFNLGPRECQKTISLADEAAEALFHD